MLKYALLTLLIFLNSTLSEAQNSNNASGNDLLNSYGSVTYSVGEVFYVQKGAKYTLSEGVQNARMTHANRNNASFKVSVYPNPTSDFLNFKVQDLFFDNLAYTIYNETGKELLNGKIQNANTIVSLSQLPASVYLCKVYRDQVEMTTLKIIKIN